MDKAFKSIVSHGCRYIKRNLGAYFPEIGLHSQFQIFIELTTRCNMRCSYCNLWNVDHSGEVSAEVWKEMFSELLDTIQTPKVYFSGGEPFLSPVLFDLLQICVDKGAYPGFVTNGRLLNDKNIEKLVQLNIANINISLDDDRPEVFDRVRNAPGHTELVFSNIARLQKALKAHACRTKIYLKSVIHAENTDRLEHMVKLADNYGCMISFQPLSAPFGKPFKKDWYLTEPLWPAAAVLPVLHENIDKLLKMKQENAPVANSVHEMTQWHQYFDDPSGFDKHLDESPCLIGYSNLYIFSDGLVKYCPTRPAIGNIKEGKIRDILMSKKSEEEIIRMRKCPGQSCVKTCMTQKNLFELVSTFLKLAGSRK
ncbi:MAG: radical SAM protein [Lentisphaeria bacterium]|nr:radical SAM protein [Lentisphaeria bacterium]